MVSSSLLRAPKSGYDSALMDAFDLRTDIERAVIDGFALALGISAADITPPAVGYTIAYTAGGDDEPDTYSFYVAVSHERVAPIVTKVFSLLAQEVSAIVEISSRDAYRQTDVFLSREEINRREFLDTWRTWQSILLEDGSIGAGANSENPFVEVFVDQWKGISIIVPLDMRHEVEKLLMSMELQEVPETWDVGEDNRALEAVKIRPVLASLNGASADIDDVLLELRRQWDMELNIDSETNLDDGGRALGLTLWHAILGVHGASNADQIAEMSVWATAGSLDELELLIDGMLRETDEWALDEVYSTDRVAYDERPDELAAMEPRREHAELHLVLIETGDGDPPADDP